MCDCTETVTNSIRSVVYNQKSRDLYTGDRILEHGICDSMGNRNGGED